MAALNFPTLPTLNQQYPVPAIPGVPVYTWDGEKWTTYGASITNAFPATALPLMDATPAVVGITSKYAREDHVHPTDTTRADATTVLVKSPQGLTPTEQTDVRKNVYAAPLDALAYSGMQINGSMEVNQEGVSATAHGISFCDGWRLLKTGTMVVVAQQFAARIFPVGLNGAMNISVSTAQASLGAGDFTGFYQPIEGYRMSRLSWGTAEAQPITIGFWSRHIRPGLYSGTVRNSATDRSYAFTYTHAVTDVGQYNTVTIPGCTDGTWLTTNGVGMYLAFSNGCGTTLTAPSANTWLNSSYLAAPGQVNGVTATSDVFRISGVVVLPGIEAPSAARSPLIMRPYDQELLICQRYWNTNPFMFGQFVATTTIYLTSLIAPTMRAAPASALMGNGVGFINELGVAARNVSAIGVASNTVNSAYLSVTTTTPGTIGNRATLTANAASLDARL